MFVVYKNVIGVVDQIAIPAFGLFVCMAFINHYCREGFMPIFGELLIKLSGQNSLNMITKGLRENEFSFLHWLQYRIIN